MILYIETLSFIYIADSLTEDGVFYMNNADDSAVSKDNPNFTQTVTMRKIREMLSNKDRSRSENDISSNSTTETNTNTNTPTPAREGAEDPRVAALETGLAEQREQNRRIMERLNQNNTQIQTQEEEGLDSTTKALIAVVALGGAFLIYKKMQAKKQQS